MDILARITAQDDKIKGFKISSEEIKMTQYADDLTLMLSDFISITEALSLLTKFGDSGNVTWIMEKEIKVTPKYYLNRRAYKAFGYIYIINN